MTETTEKLVFTPEEMLKRLPKQLSPSRVNDFNQCAKSFYFKTIEKRSSPAKLSNAVGTLSHLVFDQVFDHPREARTVELAHSLLPSAWESISGPGARFSRSAEEYRALAPEGSEAEAQLFADAKEAVARWFEMERIGNFDPERREMTVATVIEGVRVSGILDRLDSYETGPEGERRRVWVITDYKSGKVPRDDYVDWFPMAYYAYALWKAHGVVVSQLRLVYTKTGDRENGIKTRAVTSELIKDAAARFPKARADMEAACQSNTWPASASALCGWCSFSDECPEGTAELARRSARA
jgi:putative RecB family exonuclease